MLNMNHMKLIIMICLVEILHDNDDSTHDNTEQEKMKIVKMKEKPDEQQNPQEELKYQICTKIRDIDMGDIEEEYTRRKKMICLLNFIAIRYEKEYKTRLERYKSK